MLKKIIASMIVFGLSGGEAMADPFMQEKGTGRIIASGIHTRSGKGFDNNGNVEDINTYKQNQIYLQAQYGLTEDLTVLLTPSYRDVEVTGGDDTSGLGYTDVGARYRLAHGGNWVVSAQGLVRIPGRERADRIAQIGNTDMEYDVRLGAGYGKGPFFASVEGGYRFRAGDPPNEFRMEMAAGARVAPRLMVIGTSINVFSDGKGERIFDQSYRYGDLYLSAVYEISSNISLQAGYTGTIYGKNALRQRGPFIGVWYSF